jgi:hypothetical protein
MKKIIWLIAVLLLVTFQSCTKYNCEDVACFTPPQPFYFEFVDKTTGDDLFANGKLDSTQIEVFNSADTTNIEYNFIGTDTSNLVVIYGIGWEKDRTKVDVTMNVSGVDLFYLYLDSERMTDECCTYTQYHEVRIDSAEYKISPETGIYTVLLD